MKNYNINKFFDYLETIANIANDPTTIADKLKQSQIFNFPNNLDSKNNMNNNIYAEPEDNNIEYNKSVPEKNNKSYENSNPYNYNESNDYSNKAKDTSSNPQGVIDSIAQELTSARLQQAIILSEIVGKPRSKTRRKRRF